MQGVFDSNEIAALEEQLRFFQQMFSATCLMLLDDKGKVRINKQILNRVTKINELKYEQNAAGAWIIEVTMGPKEPKPKPKAKKK